MFVDFGSEMTPVSVISSYRLLSSPVGVVTRQKHRKCWGIALKAGGRTVYTQDGKQILSDKNHIVLLPKGARYDWTCYDQGECIVIDFDALEEGHAVRCVEVNDNSFFLAAFGKLENMNLDDPVCRLEAMQILYGVLLHLARAAGKHYIPKDKRYILEPALEYMMEHYSEPQICNDDLASRCGISTVYFRKTFEAVYGTSPIRYLHELRISKAKAILCGDYGSIGQIAESVGYSSVYHFSKMFKLYTGQSPTEFAKSGKK